jgi:hypothetical protein
MRTLFVDAAEEILRSEGYRGISARQVSAKAGLKTQLLYYLVFPRIGLSDEEQWHSPINSAHE